MTLDLVIFIISALTAIFGALMMIFQRNPVASVMYMILSLVSQAVLYMQLGALFIGAVLIIVYAGAILVLFLFVIMMLNLRQTEDMDSDSTPISKLAKFLVSGLLFLEMLFVVRGSYFQSSVETGLLSPQIDDFGSVESVAELLFTTYLYPFELTSILLLTAIVGAVVIARKPSNEDPVEILPFDSDDDEFKSAKAAE